MKLGALAILAVALASSCGCAHKGGWEKAARGEFPLGAPQLPILEREYYLAVGDQISLHVSFHDDFNTKAVVRPDGKVTFPVVGETMAAGYTPSQLDSLVTGKFEELIIDPNVSIIVEEYSEQLVYVLGEVGRPGAYEVQRGMTVSNAISQAGGPTEIAKLTDVVLIRRETPYKATGAKLDLERFLNEGDYAADAYLQAYDIVYVPKTRIGALSEWLDTFFRGWTHPLTLIVRGYDMVLIEKKLD